MAALVGVIVALALIVLLAKIAIWLVLLPFRLVFWSVAFVLVPLKLLAVLTAGIVGVALLAAVVLAVASVLLAVFLPFVPVLLMALLIVAIVRPRPAMAR